ncbi:hypothetical protein [Prosthecobacter fluviatilis]|uniref:Nucleoside 2-deoxyribosyltransferase n=1 Tax=Prosthecobacter fluviatilis TaxID=445931 RepID=A0ABW0KVS2_9BACT
MESVPQPSPQTKPKLFCFVLMPFSSDFDDIYQFGIKDACQAAGAYCERVDEQHYNERMLDRIYNQIAKADLIIADMTGKNANVFYEVGYAHALGKPTVLLTQNAADIPFDLTQFLHIVYEKKLKVLQEKLTARVLWHIEHPTATPQDTSFPLDLLINGISPLRSEIVLCCDESRYWIDIPVTIHNRSSHHFGSDAFKLGVILEKAVDNVGTGFRENVSSAVLENGLVQYILPSRKSLMPGEVQAIKIGFSFNPSLVIGKRAATLRLFTPNTYRDFPFQWASNSSEQ